VDDLPLPRRIRDVCHGASVGCVASRQGETPRETLRRAGAEMQRHKRRRKSDRR
jgi:hypothetical protein